MMEPLLTTSCSRRIAGCWLACVVYTCRLMTTAPVLTSICRDARRKAPTPLPLLHSERLVKDVL